jgi:fucose 4-O-acetylase-like acetyltransferase
MEKKAITQERIVWLDWMKVLAILSIIWGHFFSEGHVYLYVFSVQVFCLISGFLYKKASDWKTCIKRCFWQLFVPTVIMSLIMQLEAYSRCMALGTSYDISWPWFFEWLLLGHRWCMGPCWYFYSLMVMRLIMQALPEQKWAYGLLFVVLSAGAIVYHYKGYEMSNANVNVLVCMPFFLIGVFLKPLKQMLNGLHNYAAEAALLALGIGLVVVCGNYNGYVWMYENGYGNNYALYIIGGMAGAMMLYAISLWLSRLPYRQMVLTLSKGSLLIIGLHIVIVRRLTELPDRLWGEDLLFSLLILFFFVPVIQLVERYCPLLIGQYKR